MELPQFYMVHKIQNKLVDESVYPHPLYILLEDIQNGADPTIMHKPPPWHIRFKATLTDKHMIYSPITHQTKSLGSVDISGREYFWIKYPLVCANPTSELQFITTNPYRIDRYLEEVDKLVMIDTL